MNTGGCRAEQVVHSFTVILNDILHRKHAPSTPPDTHNLWIQMTSRLLRNPIHTLVLNTCDSLITVRSWRHLPLITGANCNLPLAETEYVWQGEENHWITPVIARLGWLSFVIHCSARSPVSLWDRKLLMSGPRAHCFLKSPRCAQARPEQAASKLH